MEENTRDREFYAKANKPCYGLFGSTGGHLGVFFFDAVNGSRAYTCTHLHAHTQTFELRFHEHND